ncbi:MAG: RloB domain-containing protein, partial [Candidatus Methylacidiphilales bacterium]
MPGIRHLIVCEGESERAYLQQLQAFLEKQPLKPGAFESPVKFIGPQSAVTKSGVFSNLKNQYSSVRRDNKKASIQIWADFDLYHRNHKKCAENYAKRPPGIPNFCFSFHNFEDFYALHLESTEFNQWLAFGNAEHFASPLHAEQYIPEFLRICPDYKKAEIPVEFITWDSLRNLKRNKSQQPTSNPWKLQDIYGFADFLISQLEIAYPGQL